MDSERDVVGGGEDRVEQAAAAMRQTHVPQIPAGLMERTIVRAGGAGSGEVGAARAASEKKGSKDRGWWSMKMVRRTAVAAALAVAVGSAVVLAPWGGGARVAFADVVEQVKAAHLARCKVDMVVEVPGQKETKATFDVLMSEEGLVNMTFGKARSVVDEASGKMMAIDDVHKTVIVMDKTGGKGAGQAAPNLLTQFKEMNGEGKALGEKEIGGRKAKGFLVEKGKRTFEVWADEATEKPLLVVMKVQEGMAPAVQFTFREFEWDPKDVATLTKFEVPAGYREVKSTMNMGPLEEKDVVEMLPILGGFNEGVLPEKVDMGSVLVKVRAWAEKHLEGANTLEAQETMMKQMMPVGRAWGYMGDAKKGTEWTYAGAGVKVGEKGKAVLWYQPTGKQAWRVIDADGAVHEEKEKPAGGEKVEMNVGALLGAGTQPGK
jgi:hypothetical protein